MDDTAALFSHGVLHQCAAHKSVTRAFMPKFVCLGRRQLLNGRGYGLARSALSTLTLHAFNILLLLIAFGQFKLDIVTMEATFHVLNHLHA